MKLNRKKWGFTLCRHPELDSGSRCLIDQNGEIPNQVWNDNYFGFTLLELLVVVLIIGILAAVALSQYQKAVERSKATQALTMLRTLAQAAETFYLAQGQWPTTFEELDINVPWTGNERILSSSINYDTKSNEDWSLQIDNAGRTGTNGLYIWRLSGKYKAAGFTVQKQTSDSTLPLLQTLCLERVTEGGATAKFSLPAGAYCEQVMHGKKIPGSSQIYNRYYILP